MCRLYGFHANEPTKVECSLVHAQNALLGQSRLDARGETNADGWGIAFYAGHGPEVERRDTAAHADEHFSLTAERVFARTVVAHVRGATVGAGGVCNTHPFIYGSWSFAHNGTVVGFDQVGPQLAEQTDPDFLGLRRGTTDSEAVFWWWLTRLRAAGLDPGGTIVDLDDLARKLREGVVELRRLCRAADESHSAQLNFLLTDGSVMLASRLGRSLYIVERNGVHDCEICGIPHIHHTPPVAYRAVAIASEPISHEHWREVPESSIVTVGTDLKVQIFPI